jgi:hypothetical protein
LNKQDRENEILATARERLLSSISAFSETRTNQENDLKFSAGSSDNNWQWPANVVTSRTTEGGLSPRPCLTINKLPQHINQITNDQRQNRPSGKVIPVDDKADVEVAEIFNGMIRHIEYASNADVVYATACENQVTHGEGYIRIITDYCDSDTFDQDIKLIRVKNSFSIYPDPLTQDPCGADMEWCFITEDMTETEFHRQYPKATPISQLEQSGVGDSDRITWINERGIRIAEYFYVEHTMETLNLYPDNITAFEGTTEDKAYKRLFGTPLRSRLSDKRQVKWCKINGYQILEKRDWPGKYIPIVRIVGNEYEVDGKLYFSGIVRNAKDAQRMYNYWTSQEAEMLALAPKAPFIGYAGQFEGFETKWQTANVNNWPYLEVNPSVTDAQNMVLPLPVRSQPPMAQNGLIQAKVGAAEDIKSTTGQYNASLGMTSNERSGKAIMARQREGDIGTYHYGDNLGRGGRFVSVQLVDLIPKIYDTARIARIIGEDGDTKMVKINPDQQEPVKRIKNEENIEIEKIYNPSVGKYDVVVTTGPSYATKRQESLEGMATLLQANERLWDVAGDLFVKNMDWPGASELSKRLAKTIDPKLTEESDDSPALQKSKQDIQMLQEELSKAMQMLQDVNQSIEARDIAVKERDSETKAYSAETQRLAVVQDNLKPDQIQDIVRGTIDAAKEMGDIS